MKDQTAKDRHVVALQTIGFTGSLEDLVKIERKVRNAATRLCNDYTYSQERFDSVKDRAREQVASLFGGSLPNGFYLNCDPRGSALRLDCEVTEIPQGLFKNFGGDGVLAPEF